MPCVVYCVTNLPGDVGRVTRVKFESRRRHTVVLELAANVHWEEETKILKEKGSGAACYFSDPR